MPDKTRKDNHHGNRGRRYKKVDGVDTYIDFPYAEDGERDCHARVFGDWHPHQCSKRGTKEHQGHQYCHIHHPPSKAARDAKRRAKYDFEDEGRRLKWKSSDLHRVIAEKAIAHLRQEVPFEEVEEAVYAWEANCKEVEAHNAKKTD